MSWFSRVRAGMDLTRGTRAAKCRFLSCWCSQLWVSCIGAAFPPAQWVKGARLMVAATKPPRTSSGLVNDTKKSIILSRQLSIFFPRLGRAPAELCHRCVQLKGSGDGAKVEYHIKIEKQGSNTAPHNTSSCCNETCQGVLPPLQSPYCHLKNGDFFSEKSF